MTMYRQEMSDLLSQRILHLLVGGTYIFGDLVLLLVVVLIAAQVHHALPLLYLVVVAVGICLTTKSSIIFRSNKQWSDGQ